MDRPIILMETQTKAIEPVPGGMWQKRAAELLGAGVGAVNHWVRTYREGVLLQCLFDRFGSVFPQCGLMVFPGVVIVSR